MKPASITRVLAAQLLPVRDERGHKYDFGHVLVIGGSAAFPGAPSLAARGALAAGAGLVTLCVPASVADIVLSRSPAETMRIALPDRGTGAMEPLAVETTVNLILERRVTTLCIGCGMGRSAETRDYVNGLLSAVYADGSRLAETLYTVLDADGCTALDLRTADIPALRHQRHRVVLTPHLGEYERLTGKPRASFSHRLAAEAADFGRDHHVTLVLKSATTVVSDGTQTFALDAPNSALAKGGSGDVLAGIIAGLAFPCDVGSRVPHRFGTLLQASLLGVWLHARAAYHGRRRRTAFSLLPSELPTFLPDVFREIL